MSYDNLTVAAIAVVVVIIVVVILLARSQSSTELKMRKLVRNLAMMQSSEEAKEICREIRSKYPDMCVGLDFTLKEESGNVSIDEWNSDKQKPNA
jgi:signal transduction histidine kinase